MTRSSIIVRNKVGLHARPASMFVKEAKKYQSTITVKLNDKEANGKSILEILTLGAEQGARIEVMADGRDERQALDALRKVVETDIEQ
ncbi:MAG: HPr family phosphocarrier protein [Clostridia bacterium]|nr:HPr family phosphocarrier protein [Clostridia bacterium]